MIEPGRGKIWLTPLTQLGSRLEKLVKVLWLKVLTAILIMLFAVDILTRQLNMPG